MLSVCRNLMLFAVLSLVASTGFAQVPEAYQAVGTWKLNVSKSTGTSNQLKSRSRIHTVENRGGGVMVNKIEQINADGSKQVTYFTTKADGTDYPMISIGSDGTTNVGTMAETRVDAYTIRWVIKNADGKDTAPDVKRLRTVSKDGKTFTLSGGANGNTTVYERQ